MENVKIEIAHTLSDQQLKEISEKVYLTTLEAIEKARRDVDLDNDLIATKAGVCKFLGISPNYLEELISRGLPTGKKISDRKQYFSKKKIQEFLLENE